MRIHSPPLSYLLLICVALLAFNASLVNGFEFDDLIHVVDNSAIKQLSFSSIFLNYSGGYHLFCIILL